MLFHITDVRVNDKNVMEVIPYEVNVFRIFDCCYNGFKRLHNIESVGAYFMVRGKVANDFKPMKWARGFRLVRSSFQTALAI